jgi:phosphatidylserine synthase
MKKGIYVLPNLITLSSMFAGFYSIIASLNSDYEMAAWAIMIASVFDVLDGWVARMTHTATRFVSPGLMCKWAVRKRSILRGSLRLPLRL